jgi:MEMO1 family protein
MMKMTTRGILVLVMFAYALFLAACTGNEGEGKVKKETGKVVRQALGGGRWFPGSKAELAPMVSNFIEKAESTKLEGRIVGVIAPHAGYIYSGKVAGHTFRAVRDNARAGYKPETVVILGFPHRANLQGVALMDGDAIETPLGVATLDSEAASILMRNRPGIFMEYSPHAGEHSAENEIPFVQAALPDAKLVVALMGDHNPTTIKELVAGLNELAGKKQILVVASSDMLHDADYELVSKTDKATLTKVAAMDHAGLMKSWGYSSQVFCGIGPVETVMQFAEAQGCKKGTVLYYRNSGDDFPESRGNWVVGYGAVAFIGGSK